MTIRHLDAVLRPGAVALICGAAGDRLTQVLARNLLQFIDAQLPLPRRIARLEISRQRLIEYRQPHRILLLDRHIRQTRRDRGGMIVFGPLAAADTDRPKSH